MPGLRLTGPDDVIDIRVVADPSDDQVVFKMRKRMQLQRLIEAFHAHRRQRAGTYIFFYNSEEVNAADTPESLQMSGNDYVTAAPNPAYAHYTPRRISASQSFYISVVGAEAGERECLFRIRRNSRMEKLMHAYEERIRTGSRTRIFFYDAVTIFDYNYADVYKYKS